MKRRPKDRKVQIARAATDAFSELGYHAVSMENIAARVGISAAALYRHSQGKYDLFREVFLALASNWWTPRRSPTTCPPTPIRGKP